MGGVKLFLAAAIAAIAIGGYVVGPAEAQVVDRDGARHVEKRSHHKTGKRVDFTGLNVNEEEKRTLAGINKYRKRRQRASNAIFGVIGASAGLAVLSLLGLRSAYRHMSKTRAIPAAAGLGSSFAGMLLALIPAAISESAALKEQKLSKNLELLFEKRLKQQANNDQKTGLLKREVIGKDGLVVDADDTVYDQSKLLKTLGNTPDFT